MILHKKLSLSKELAIGPQPNSEEIAMLSKAGFKTVINLRRKGEIDQPLSPDEEREIVEEAGMTYVHIPVSLSNMKAQHVDEFRTAMKEHKKPVFVHCGLGQRSAPFGLIRHAINKKLSAEKLFEKVEKLNLAWNAPFLRSFVRQYIDFRQKEA